MHAALLKLGYETGMQGQSCEKVQYESEVLGNEPLYPAFYGVVVIIQLQQQLSQSQSFSPKAQLQQIFSFSSFFLFGAKRGADPISSFDFP